jgi:predicted DNA repair protein MutK
MKTLSVVGTIAMFLVGGGILLHAIPGAESAIQQLPLPYGLHSIVPMLAAGIVGLIAGAILVTALQPLLKHQKH